MGFCAWLAAACLSAESVDDWAAVRWAGLEEVAPEASIGLALCVNLSKPWPYAFDEGVYPEHPVWGKDPLSPFIEWCRAKGITPYFSTRMNDQHHSVHNHPMYHPGPLFLGSSGAVPRPAIARRMGGALPPLAQYRRERAETAAQILPPPRRKLP